MAAVDSTTFRCIYPARSRFGFAPLQVHKVVSKTMAKDSLFPLGGNDSVWYTQLYLPNYTTLGISTAYVPQCSIERLITTISLLHLTRLI
jgi:hypothetical protein